MMTNIKNNRVLLFFVIPLFSVGFFSYCANPAAPQGGPVDSLPPKVISIDPPMFSLNFNAKRVTILFDEYIVAQNTQSEIVISPEMQRKPIFTVKGKQLLIDFEEKLDSATTYKIDFGQSIKDNNENNPLGNFSYVFSTGDEIDSLAMSGQVVDAFTGDSILNALILLYDAKADSLEADSVLFNSTPSSVARTDSMGVFIATNLKPIDYRVYAISEESSDGKYNKGTDMVAFVDSMLNPAKMSSFDVWYNPMRRRIEATPQVVYRLFTEPAPSKRQNLQKSSRTDKNIVVLEFADKFPQIDSLVLDSIDIEDVVIEYSRSRDTIKIFYPYMENMPDTLKGSVKYLTTTSDSLAQDTMVTKKFGLTFHEVKSKKKDRDNNKDNESDGRGDRGDRGKRGERGEKEGNSEKDEIGKVDNRDVKGSGEDDEKNLFFMTFKADNPFNPENIVTLDFKYPLIFVDSANMVLEKIIEKDEKEERGARGSRTTQQPKSEATTSGEGAKMVEIVPFTLTRDSLTVLRWNLAANWEDGAKYTFTMNDSVFVNNLLQKNDSISQTITVMDQTKYGLVNVELVNKEPNVNYIVMLEKDKKPVYQQKYNSGDRVTFKYVSPGKYNIKVIEDVNNNGKWDEGVVVDRISPERIAIYEQRTGNTIFEVKENWELEDIELDLKRMFK